MSRSKSEAEIAYDKHVEECKMCFLVDKGWRVGLYACKIPVIRRCEAGRALMKPLSEEIRAKYRERKEDRALRWKARHEASIQAIQSAE